VQGLTKGLLAFVVSERQIFICSGFIFGFILKVDLSILKVSYFLRCCAQMPCSKA